MNTISNKKLLIREKNVLTDKKYVLWKMDFKLSKPKIQTFMHNSIYFDIKCEVWYKMWTLCSH